MNPKRGPFSATCATRELLDQLADKWSVLLLIALARGPVRFNALKREVEGISQKVLGQALKRLERNGLVVRRAFATVPVTVEYEVTTLGRSLYPIVESLRGWSIDHIGAVKSARTRYDARHRGRANLGASPGSMPSRRPCFPGGGASRRARRQS